MKAVALISGLLLLPLALIFAIMLSSSSAQAKTCGGTPATVEAAKVPDSAAGYNQAQLLEAAATVDAGVAVNAPPQAQTIALAVAITQTSLTKPYTGAAAFYGALLASKNWQSLEPSVAANQVLGGADPHAYEAAYGDAKKIMTVFGTGTGSCVSGPAGSVNDNGWARPAAGRIINGFGPRAPICTASGCSGAFHSGDDLPGALGTPIYAAAAGVVVATGPNGSYGNWIVLDNGGGIATIYAHMYADGIFVHVGQHVDAGQNIASIGCAGVCTGPHLHFEVRINGRQIDPAPFMRQRGIDLG
ncbi:MAG: M23 family metallopeptidase [Actinomycetota bacterium]|nr:M23 family metallopeptidase [Actinomycetota bacterium]